jgi:hypothetical protein
MSNKKTAQNGKGSKPRPINKKEFDKSFDRIWPDKKKRNKEK